MDVLHCVAVDLLHRHEHEGSEIKLANFAIAANVQILQITQSDFAAKKVLAKMRPVT